jgi:3-hydroxyacyl-[acyl-carrier-protein] dehydratase
MTNAATTTGAPTATNAATTRGAATTTGAATMTDAGDPAHHPGLIELRSLSQPEQMGPILLRFPADHPAGPGHFPGNPIIPGAVLLDELVLALFPAGWSGEVESARFHHPVRPGDTVAITHRTEGNSTRFECRLAEVNQLVLSGVLRTTFSPR